MGIKRLVTIIHLAREQDRAERNGETFIRVPQWMQSEVNALIWQRKVKRAAERWKNVLAQVDLEEWQRAILNGAARMPPGRGTDNNDAASHDTPQEDRPMTGIEEHAQRWADERERKHPADIGYAKIDLMQAYMAGMTQAQRDYTRGMGRGNNADR